MSVLAAGLMALVATARPAPFAKEVYQERRAALSKQLKGCVAVLYSRSTPEVLDRDFYWLTGIAEPGAILTLAPQEKVYRDVVYLAARDPDDERFNGPREDLRPELNQKLGFDFVGRVAYLRMFLDNAVRRAGCLTRIDTDADTAPAGQLYGTLAAAYGSNVTSQREWVKKQRMLKQPVELERINGALAATTAGFQAALRALKPAVTERQLWRALVAGMLQAGGNGEAEFSIVAAGPHSAVGHWQADDTPIAADGLLIIDAGATAGDYAADLARTVPVSGHFTAEQRASYELVLKVHEALLKEMKPGVTLDVLNKRAETMFLAAGHRDGFIHFVGHHVGLEMHDDPFDFMTPLEPGMVVMVEPGIYFPGRYGVRLEDMVLITKGGAQVMSAQVPRTVEQVEAWVQQARGSH